MCSAVNSSVPAPPIRVIVQMEERPKPLPEPETTQDKVKKIAADFMIAIGLLLLAGAFCMLAGGGFGLLVIEFSAVQTLFLCGLSSVMGGFSLLNPAYKGSISMNPPGLPMTFKIEQK